MAPLDEVVAALYEAVGDDERWQHVEQQVASLPTMTDEVAYHLAVARAAHEQHTRSRRNVAALSQLHSAVGLATIVVTGDGRVEHTSVAAQSLVDAGDGLRIEAGRLVAADPDTDARLQATIARAADPDAGDTSADQPFVFIARHRGSRLAVLVVTARPSANPLETDRPVTLLVVDPERTVTPSARTLQALFGFTVREAALAQRLLAGDSVTDAAAALRVSMATARTFLAHVMAKTDSHGQAELMARLLTIPRGAARTTDVPEPAREGG